MFRAYCAHVHALYAVSNPSLELVWTGKGERACFLNTTECFTMHAAGRNAQSAARGIDAAAAGMSDALAARVGTLGRDLAGQLQAELRAQAATPLSGLSGIVQRLEVGSPF